MREIRTLRARWRELETEPRTGLNGHEGRNPGYSQASVLTGHRASSRPYRDFTIRYPADEPYVVRFVGLSPARGCETRTPFNQRLSLRVVLFNLPTLRLLRRW